MIYKNIFNFREQDLVSMVDFMYCGEAHIKESDLETFLNAAKDLQVIYTLDLSLLFTFYKKSHGYICFLNMLS